MAKWLNAWLLSGLLGALTAGLCSALTATAGRQMSPADVYRLASSYASGLDADLHGRAHDALFISLHAVPAEKRAKYVQFLGYVLNSLNTRNDRLSQPAIVPSCDLGLVYVDLTAFGLKRADMDRLGQLGSGPAPFPESFFHKSAERVVREAPKRTLREETILVRESYEVEEQERTPEGWVVQRQNEHGQFVPSKKKVTRWREVKKKRAVEVPAAPARETKSTDVLVGEHLPKGDVIALAALTGTDFPVFEFYWFVANVLVEPRYHEILGLDDRVETVERLAGLDALGAERRGSKTRGAVLLSEVGERNRVLERFPTLSKFGRGTFQRSLDFKTSVRRQNVLSNLLVRKADAFEVIWTLDNGLQGFFIADGKGNRLDKADPDVAQDNRTKFRDHQVRTAYKCMACHLTEKGWMPVEDEVSLGFAKRQVKLLARTFDEQGDRTRGDLIRQQYLSIDFNELVEQDQVFHDQAVKAATGGLSSQEVGEVLVEVIHYWIDADRTVDDLSRMTGAPKEEVLRAIESTPGLKAAFVGIRVNRRQRADQVEEGLADLLAVLYARQH